MAARIIGLSSLILAASLISHTQAAGWDCDEDKGWLDLEGNEAQEAECSGHEHVSCSSSHCCKERTCTSVNTTNLKCPEGTEAKEGSEETSLNHCMGDDETACVINRCCQGMTCANIGEALGGLTCPDSTAKETPAQISLVSAYTSSWYSSCCDLPTCSSQSDSSCPSGYTVKDAAYNMFNSKLTDDFTEQCCELPSCTSSEGDSEGMSCPDGEMVNNAGLYNSESSTDFEGQCCVVQTCSANGTSCGDDHTTIWGKEWVWGDDSDFQTTCCELKSCSSVGSFRDVSCDGGKVFVGDSYDPDGVFDADAFKEACCKEPEEAALCKDYVAPSPSASIDGGFRTTCPGIIAAAIGGSAMFWGSWAVLSPAS